MRFCFIHLHDDPRSSDEAMVVAPGLEKTAIAVPLDELPDFLPVLEEAMADAPAASCEQCGAELHVRAQDDG